MNDKGDPPQDGAVLIAPLGKGVYVYTTFAFFRELPAGNPGAARLFVNLLSATPAAANRPPHPPSDSGAPVSLDPRLVAFVGVAAVLTILPGADMALVMRNVLALGRPKTMLTIAGIACGCVIHATASALGMSAVLATSATAFTVMKDGRRRLSRLDRRAIVSTAGGGCRGRTIERNARRRRRSLRDS